MSVTVREQEEAKLDFKLYSTSRVKHLKPNIK